MWTQRQSIDQSRSQTEFANEYIKNFWSFVRKNYWKRLQILLCARCISCPLLYCPQESLELRRMLILTWASKITRVTFVSTLHYIWTECMGCCKGQLAWGGHLPHRMIACCFWNVRARFDVGWHIKDPLIGICTCRTMGRDCTYRYSYQMLFEITKQFSKVSL